MSSGQGATPPMYFCHVCGIEIRPLMTPQPTCPRCNGGFVEELDSSRAAQEEDEQDDDDGGGNMAGTAHFWNPGMDAHAQGPGLDIGQLMASIVRGLAAAGQDRQPPSERVNVPQRPASEPSSHVNDPLGVNAGGASSGSGGGGEDGHRSQGTTSDSSAPQGQFRTGTARFGPVNVSWGVGSQQATTMTGGRAGSGGLGLGNYTRQDDGMGGAGAAADGRFFNHDNDMFDSEPSGQDDAPFGTRLGGGDRTTGQGTQGRGEPDLPPELASLREIFSNLFGGIEEGPGGMLMDMFGGALRGGGRSGDYVWGQQGLDDVITQLMEASRGSTAPPPATEDAIAKLDRFTRKDANKVRSARNEECPTCMDSFLEEEDRDPQDASKDSNLPTSDAAGMDMDDSPEVVPMEDQQNELVMMPCRHLFHQDCLIPWLKSSGTCPVCRITLDTKAPEQSNSTTNDPSQAETSSRTSAAQHPLASTSSSSPTMLYSSEYLALPTRSSLVHEREDTDVEDGDEDDDSPTQRRDRMRRAAEGRQQQQQQQRSPNVPGAFLPADDLD